MFTSEDFYNSYQLNFFDYKQNVNENLLNQDDDFLNKISKGILHSNVEEFRQNIKLDIRMTCLWSIDALFELIYAILPDHKQRIQDNHILDNLASKSQYYRDLRKYVAGSKGTFDRFKWFIHYNKRNTNKNYACSVLRHIFYKGLFELTEEKEIVESVKAIETLLKILGNEISENREQLNSFKHGLKTIPFLKEFKVREVEDPKKGVDFDLSDSYSFQTIDKRTGKRTIITSTLNQERDFALTQLSTNLIYNIIILRKTNLKGFKLEGGYNAFLFSDVTIEEINKLHPKINNLKIQFD